MSSATLPTSSPGDLVECYLAAAERAGLERDGARQSARAFIQQVGTIEQWQHLSLDDKLRLGRRARRVAVWMVVTGQAWAPVDFVIARNVYLGAHAATFHPVYRQSIRSGASAVGFTGRSLERQWAMLAKISALVGCPPQEVNEAMLARGRELMFSAAMVQGRPGYAEHVGMDIYQLRSTMFHLGIIETPPDRLGPASIADREALWEMVPESLAVTPLRYLRQIELSLRPATVRQIEHTLREFCCLVAGLDPDVQSASNLRREHVEAYKSWLGKRVSTKTGKALTRNTVGKRLGLLANFFERATEWGWDDVPSRIPVFASDKPIPDERLPRFVDDAAATKLLIATRSDPDLFTRVVVEMLARTGLRIGELLDLTVDAAVQIGSAYWLRVPLGKLHNDRYIPLHPQLKHLLDQWIAKRPRELRSPYLFVEQGRRIPQARVRLALAKVAARAGIGHVTPHQLRHTLATQAINRGMSLEALAALLGHKTLSMTLVYARIADRTVADEYFAVSEKVDELYEKAGALPAEAEGTKMSKLRNEMDRRMLGNGYCARPVDMDCHFESICESCAFFVTTIDFKPTLERQRNDAEAKGQVGRKRVFDGLLQRLDSEVS